MFIESDHAAWWGAVVATVVLLWDIIKWSGNRPRIRVNAKMPVSYFDSERAKKEILPEEEDFELETYCHIEITNLGSMPTTIVSVCCSNKPTKAIGLHSNHNIAIHSGHTLPHVLGAGQLWSCRIPDSSVKNIASQYSKAYIRVNLSHKKRPLFAEIKIA